MDARLPIVATLGEPAGVGAELIALSWLRRGQEGLAPFYCIADEAFLAARFEAAELPVPLTRISEAREAADRFSSGLPVLPLTNPVRSGRPGMPSPEHAPAVLQSIARAVAHPPAGAAGAIVTAPVQKETLYDAGFEFPGHTELLGDLTRDWPGGGGPPVMMLVSQELRVVPITVHVPLSAVPKLLTEELIVTTGRIVAQEMAAKFAVASPRLAFAGLNPHAGEGGRIGREERDVIAPAIARLCSEGINATGPFPGDTLFHAAARTKYDAVLATYHDQALIPIKTIAFDSAVNLTLGLPLVRTSPDHGTALALAGTGRARPASLIAALKMAAELAAREPMR
jgi:4-hydroxythreonine-4-phosphate dehydrogenase